MAIFVCGALLPIWVDRSERMTSPFRILTGATAEFKISLFYFNQKNVFCLKIITFLDALTFPLFQSSTVGTDFFFKKLTFFHKC